jgi:hypothetical protein
MVSVVWSNNVTLPTKNMKSKRLMLHTPFLKSNMLTAPTTVGYESYNFVNMSDGMHGRFIIVTILGFGISYSVNWNSDGKYAN